VTRDTRGMTTLLKTLATSAAAVAVLVLSPAVAPALACGDTPGFCPNPPDHTSQPAAPLTCPECNKFGI
jgi:hypothetical protein